jgi:hypothetical protein
VKVIDRGPNHNSMTRIYLLSVFPSFVLVEDLSMLTMTTCCRQIELIEKIGPQACLFLFIFIALSASLKVFPQATTDCTTHGFTFIAPLAPNTTVVIPYCSLLAEICRSLSRQTKSTGSLSV